MAERTLLRRFADALWPFGTSRSEPLMPKRSDLVRGDVFVDPSRLFGGRLSTPYNPSVLVTRKGMNIFDQMKVDEQVKAALLFKKHAVLAAGWEVISPGDQDEDWEVTEFVRDALTAVPGGMNRALRAVMLGMDYGYSITEKVYEEREGKLLLARLISAKPHYFDFEADGHGRVLALLQRYVPGVETNERAFPPDKFIVYSHESEFENPYGRSDLEAAYRAWWTKDNAYKWLAVMLERYGMPPLFLLYNTNAYQGAEVTKLKSIVKNIQNATLGLIPRGNKDDLEFSSQQLAAQSKDVFLAALARFDADIAKALLQPSLTGFSGEGGAAENRGSLARSNVHWKAFLYVVGELQSAVATAINEQLVRPTCDLNFAGLKSYPIFRFARLDDELQVELFKTWAELVAGRVVNQIPDDETHIRSALGFPENEDPEELKQLKESKEKPKAPEEVPEEEQTTEMRQFAEVADGTWIRTAEGEVVCLAQWDESKHPRRPTGTEDGGEFAPANGPKWKSTSKGKSVDELKSLERAAWDAGSAASMKAIELKDRYNQIKSEFREIYGRAGDNRPEVWGALIEWQNADAIRKSFERQAREFRMAAKKLSGK